MATMGVPVAQEQGRNSLYPNMGTPVAYSIVSEATAYDVPAQAAPPQAMAYAVPAQAPQATAYALPAQTPPPQYAAFAEPAQAPQAMACPIPQVAPPSQPYAAPAPCCPPQYPTSAGKTVAPYVNALTPVAATANATIPVASIAVSLAGTPLVAGPKPFREYVLSISASGAEHQLQARYSVLDQALSGFATGNALWPRDIFSTLSDYVHNEANVRSRGQGLRTYLQALLNLNDGGSVVGNPRLHAALRIQIGSPLQLALAGIAAERKAVVDAARAAEAARLAAIAQQQRDDAHFAQSFNTTLAYSSLPPGALSTITFPRQQSFELRNKFWGWGDATIRGPGGHPWFQMTRTNPQLFGEVLQENFRWMNYEYDLFRIDPRSGAHVPVCRIVRQWSLFQITDQYVIQHFNQLVTGPVACFGQWPSQFSLTANGQLVARVEKQLFALTDKYHVHISPGTDVLLFLGIACAIDRIHHEVEDERERRRR